METQSVVRLLDNVAARILLDNPARVRPTLSLFLESLVVGIWEPPEILGWAFRIDHHHLCFAEGVDALWAKLAAEVEGEWNARKHGGPKRRVWRKIHLGIDEKTLEVRAIDITGSHIGDAPILPDLLDQIPPEEEIASVTADGAYDTRKCHDAIADRGAHAVIPPRKNARPWKTVTAGAVARNEALRASKYLGRAIWRNWTGYHRRSRVETKMHCVKLLGQRLMARDFDRQVAEVQVRIAVMNGYTALGIPITEVVG